MTGVHEESETADADAAATSRHRHRVNLDVLAGCGLDLVICLNPMSSRRDAPRARTPAQRAAAVVRQHVARRLHREARTVREAGTDTMLIHPTPDDLHAMATSTTSGHGGAHVIETAIASVRAHLRQSDMADRFADIPRPIGPLVRRPAGQASTWPELRALAETRSRGPCTQTSPPSRVPRG